MTAARARTIGRVLRACIAVPPARPADLEALVVGRPLPGLAAAAAFHGISGYVHRSLRAVPGADPVQMAALERQRYEALGTHMTALADLGIAGDLLDAAAVPWLVVKGPVLAELVHDQPYLRGYSDLDLVVPAARLGDTLEAFAAGGLQTIDRNWTLLRREVKGELHVLLRRGTVADVHWHLLNEQSLRRVFAIPMPELFERATEVHLAGRCVRTLHAEDTLLHLALHATLSGGHRLLWYADLACAVAVCPPDWDVLVARARAWQAGLAVGTALARARSLAGAAVPDDVVELLVPSRSWRWLSAASARLSPPERASDGGSPGRIVARATRADARASLVETARRSGAWLVNRGRPDARAVEQRFDPANPASALYACGLEDDRAGYLAAVAREGTAA